MIDGLLKLVPWPYRWLAFVVLIAAAMAFGAAKMHEFDEAKYDKLVADVDKAGAVQLAKQEERRRISKAFTDKKDADHAQEIKDTRSYWTAYVERVLGARGGEGVEPIRGPSKICNDPARDSQLSGAIAVARSDLRAAVAGYRAGLGRLFGACEVQTADLIDVQEWALREQLLNNQP